MRLETLITSLESPRPDIRLSVAQVLGMVQEARALPAIRQRYRAETDPNVRSALAWAGQQIYQAHQAGYNTIDAIFQHFGVDREIEALSSAEEAALMKKLQDELDAELAKMKAQALQKKTGTALALGLAGAALGGGAMATSMMGAALQAGGEVASSNLGADRPQIGQQRTPAVMPTNADITLWTRRLHEDPSPANREKAALELSNLNNPAALPHLATAFLTDPSPQVRQAARRFGKLLYWNALYWQMEQDGSLQQEMARRAQARGKTGPAVDGTPPGSTGPAEAQPPARPQQEENIDAILRRAQAARARRSRKR